MNQPGRAPGQRCRGPRSEISLLAPATSLDIIEQTGSLRRDAAVSRHAAPPRHRAGRSWRSALRWPRRPGHAHRPGRPRRARSLVIAAAAAGLIVAIPLTVYFVAASSPLGGSVTPCDVCQLAIPSSGPVPNVPGPSATARPARAHRSVPSEMAKVSKLVATPTSAPPAVATTPRPPPPLVAYFPWSWSGFGWWDRGSGGHGYPAGAFGGYGGGFGGQGFGGHGFGGR